MICVMSNTKIDMDSMSEIESIHIKNKTFPSDYTEVNASHKTQPSTENIKKINQKLMLLNQLYHQKNSEKVNNTITHIEKDTDDDSKNVEGLLLNQPVIPIYLKPSHISLAKNSELHLDIEKSNVHYQKNKKYSLYENKRIATNIGVINKRERLASDNLNSRQPEKTATQVPYKQALKQNEYQSGNRAKSQLKIGKDNHTTVTITTPPQLNTKLERHLTHTLTQGVVLGASLSPQAPKTSPLTKEASLPSDECQIPLSISSLHIQKKIEGELSRVVPEHIEIKKGEKEKEKVLIQPQVRLEPDMLQGASQSVMNLPEAAPKLLDMPLWRVLHQKISTLTRPPSITYVFKQWGNTTHQIKIQLIEHQVQLVASTGRVYQTSLDGLNQYQGRLPLELVSEENNERRRINAVNHDDNKEDEKS